MSQITRHTSRIKYTNDLNSSSPDATGPLRPSSFAKANWMSVVIKFDTKRLRKVWSENYICVTHFSVTFVLLSYHWLRIVRKLSWTATKLPSTAIIPEQRLTSFVQISTVWLTKQVHRTDPPPLCTYRKVQSKIFKHKRGEILNKTRRSRVLNKQMISFDAFD